MSAERVPGGVFDRAETSLGEQALADILARANQAPPLTEDQLNRLARLLDDPDEQATAAS